MMLGQWFDPYPVIRAPVLTAPVSEAAVEYDPAEPTYQNLKAQFIQKVSELNSFVAQLEKDKSRFAQNYGAAFLAGLEEINKSTTLERIRAAVSVAMQIVAQGDAYRRQLQAFMDQGELMKLEVNRRRDEMIALAKERMRTAGSYDAMKIWEARAESAGLPAQAIVPKLDEAATDSWLQMRGTINSFAKLESVSEHEARLTNWKDRLWGVEPGRTRILHPRVAPFAAVVDQAKVWDEAKVESARRARIFELAKPLRGVITSIPWPHEFFADFVWDPRSEPAAFYGAVRIYELENLLAAGYFDTPPVKIEKDVAEWLKRNGKALEAHFMFKVQQWAAEKERQEKEEAEKRGVVGLIISAVSLLTGPILGAVGQLAAAAISGGFKLFSAYQLGDQARAAMKQAQALLNISDEALHKFSEWIASKTVVGFRVTVEGRLIGTVTNETDAEKSALQSSQIGDRVEIVNTETGRSTGLLLRSEVGLLKLDLSQESQIRAMSHEALVQAVKTGTIKGKADVPSPPWWLILIPLVVK